MSTSDQGYSIRETARLCGLPESTLRYYETIGLLGPRPTGPSSGHRRYTEGDLSRAEAVACPNAARMPIGDTARAEAISRDTRAIGQELRGVVASPPGEASPHGSRGLRRSSPAWSAHPIESGGTRMDIKRNSSQPPNRGPADYFTGTVRRDAVGSGSRRGRSKRSDPATSGASCPR